MGSDPRPARITVVSPCYNEEAVIAAFVAELEAALASIPGIAYRVLLVDDGSRDRTVEAIRELARTRPWLGCLVLTRNFGHQKALSAGLAAARGDAVIVMDSDLQHPPELLPEMVARWRQGSDVVGAVRLHTPDAGPFKRLSSSWFYRVFNALSDTRITPGAADFCLLSRRVRRALCAMPERHRFLRGMIAWLGYPRSEIPYVARPRRAGASKYDVRRMTALALDAVLSFSSRPLRLVGSLGAGIALSGLAYLAYVLILALSGRGVSGWASTIGCVLVLGGVQIAVLGVVGSYLARQTEMLRGRPLYVVRERRAGAWQESRPPA